MALQTQKQLFTAAFLGGLAAIFLALALVSVMSGETIYAEVFQESLLEQEARSPEHVKSFTLADSEVLELEVAGLTLDQSWIWVKVLILDDADRAVYDYTFSLSRYHGYEGGESWSEGDQEDSKVFNLSAGTYKVLVYAEDQPTSDPNASFAARGYATVDRDEQIQVTIEQGVMLTRYYLIFGVVFALLTALYLYRRSQDGDYDVVWEGAPAGGGYGGGRDDHGSLGLVDPTAPTAASPAVEAREIDIGGWRPPSETAGNRTGETSGDDTKKEG